MWVRVKTTANLMWALLLHAIVSQPSVPALSPGCLPKDHMTDLWCPGARGVEPAFGDESVACYKIPSLLRTHRGTLLAFIEARRLQCGDGGLIDLRLRRSLNGGKSWLATQDVVVNQGALRPITWGDACPVQDRSNGRVHLILTRNNADVYHTHSDDEGAS